MRTEDARFYNQIKQAKTILVLDLGFLGDTIHLIPTLDCLRKAFPHTQLDVMVAEHIKSILAVAPYIDNVLGYPRYPKGPRWYQDFGRIRDLRRRKYDVVINVNGSDRTSVLTRTTGSKTRLGRIPPKPALFWKHCFTHTVGVERGTMPIYKQQWQCLKNAGFPGESPEFNITIPKSAYTKIEQAIDINEDYFHISPFASLKYKELSIELLASFIDQLSHAYPHIKRVLSIAPDQRHKEQLITLLNKLKSEVHVFEGNLNTLELTALISKSVIHMGGDSGALHIGLMTKRPTLSWFREYGNKVEWMPKGEEHRHIVGKFNEEGSLDIPVESLMLGAQAIMKL